MVCYHCYFHLNFINGFFMKQESSIDNRYFFLYSLDICLSPLFLISFIYRAHNLCKVTSYKMLSLINFVTTEPAATSTLSPILTHLRQYNEYNIHEIFFILSYSVLHFLKKFNHPLSLRNRIEMHLRYQNSLFSNTLGYRRICH